MRKLGTVLCVGSVVLAALAIVAPDARAAVNVSVNFLPHVDIPTGLLPRSIALADMNNDSHLDVVTGDYSSSKVSVLLGNGAGGFSPHVDFPVGGRTNRVAVGDLNEDGKPDVVTGNDVTNTVSVLLGDGAGHLSADPVHAAASVPQAVNLADLNNDSHLDVIAVSAAADAGTLSVFLGDGAGGLGTRSDVATTLSPSSVAVGDVDGDGAVDVVVGAFSADVSVFRGLGKGAFAPRVDFPSFAAVRSVALADVNGDAHLDLELVGTGFGWRLGDGAGGFGVLSGAATGANALSLAMKDVNLDGFADAVTANRDGSSVSVLAGTGAGSFLAKSDFAVAGLTNAVAVGDLNEDGRPDVVTVNDTSNNISVLLNITGQPAAPVALKNAFAGDGNATVSWTPPPFDGGSPITGYLVTPYIGYAQQPAIPVPSTATTQVVTGLTNGTTYRFKITAVNALGPGVPSTVTNAVVAGGPSAPTGVAASAGDASATVSWTAPTHDGSPVVGYAITPYKGYAPRTPVVYPSTATTQVVTGLVNGASYAFRVVAINAVATGPLSEFSNGVLPTAPLPPGAPTIGTAVAGDASATVSWTAPVFDGGAPITGYAVTAYRGYYPFTTQTFDSTATTQTITGLVNGREYGFRVRAINSAGTGGYSKISNKVTPTA
jgi:hypothetical protein